MSRKTPHELEIGAILASDVYNLDGQILLSQGLAVEEKHIEILLMWGVPYVEVNGGEEEKEGIDLTQFSQSIVDKAEAEVDQRYLLNKSSHPAVEVIRKISVLQAAKAAQVLHPNS